MWSARSRRSAIRQRIWVKAKTNPVEGDRSGSACGEVSGLKLGRVRVSMERAGMIEVGSSWLGEDEIGF